MSPTSRHPWQQVLLVSSLVGMAALLPATASAALGVAGGWNESINGDLSNEGLAPTFVTLVSGSNTLRGNSGRNATTFEVDRDYFTITIPDGFELSTMEVLAGTLSIGFGSFIGLVSGNTFPIPPDTASAAGMLGWSLFDEFNIGGDVLLFMAGPTEGSSGFTPPLPAGQYTFWVQETGIGVSTYVFDMSVTAVPEPATALSLLAGLGLLAAAMRRRS